MPIIVVLFILVNACDDTNHIGSSPVVNEAFDIDNETLFSFGDDCLDDIDNGMGQIGKIEQQMLDAAFPIDTDTEKEVGNAFHQQRNYTFIKDNRYDKLKRILNKLKRYADRKNEINYEIYLIEDDMVNAWTVMGGRIYFTTGMYDFARNDDEIANIIGHEIGHNERKHTHKHIQRRAPIGILGNALGEPAQVAISILEKGTIAFNQYQELEADRSGFYLANKAGYNPRIGLEFWQRMARQEDKNILGKFFRSHPYSDDRYRCGMDYLDAHKH